MSHICGSRSFNTSIKCAVKIVVLITRYSEVKNQFCILLYNIENTANKIKPEQTQHAGPDTIISDRDGTCKRHLDDRLLSD